MDDTQQTPQILINKSLDGVHPTHLDREGPPLQGVEQHDAGKPDDDRVAGLPTHQTLVDMAAEFEFFTPALICIAGRFDRDPVVEYNRQFPRIDEVERPFYVDYSMAFFEGLGDGFVAGQPVNWDRRIYGVRRSRWEHLRDTLAGIAIKHTPSKFFAKIGFYEMPLVDPYALKKMPVVDKLPTVTITVFGVSSNKLFTWLEPRQYPALPLKSERLPDQDTIQMAKALFGGPITS